MHIENVVDSVPTEAQYPMLKLVAYASTISIFAFLVAKILDGPQQLVLATFGLAAVSTLPLMVRAGMLLLRVDCKGNQQERLLIKANIFLHLAPACYVTLQFFVPPTLFINSIFVLPIAAFFYTGRRTWNALYEQFDTKLYKMFVKGNTAFLLNIPVLLILGFTVNEFLGVDMVKRMIVGYSAGHLLFTGFTIVKMEKQLGTIEKG